MKTWKIKKIEIKNRVVVGPLAGISNSAFRELATEFGAALIYTEMVSDKAIFYNNQKTLAMTKVGKVEGLVNMQLFGSEVKTMVFAAQYLQDNSDCALIDINMGCPVPKVVNTGAGAALMKNPDLAYDIVKAVSQAVSKPVTVKIRSGWDSKSINAVAIAQGLEVAGAAAIAVHGRPRSQFYEGQADWQIIKEVKAALKIPVIGNGDVKTVLDFYDMIEATACDGVMISRGVLGNPWLIKNIVEAEKQNDIKSEISLSEKFEVARKHALKLIELKGEKTALFEMRSHACWYICGLPGNRLVKQQINQMTSYQQFDTILKNYYQQLMSGE